MPHTPTQTTSTPVPTQLPTNGTAVCLLTSLCTPTCWPHTWWAFLSSGLLPSTLSPGLDTCSSTTSPGGAPAASLSAPLDSCSPAASSSSGLPRASCSMPLAAWLHHQPAGPSVSQGAGVQLVQHRLPYHPVNCSPDLSKDVWLSAPELGSSSGGPPQPWGGVHSLGRCFCFLWNSL